MTILKSMKVNGKDYPWLSHIFGKDYNDYPIYSGNMFEITKQLGL